MDAPHWTDDKPHMWDERRTGADISDETAASRIRMLLRSDPQHEFACLLARDRIAYLSRQNAGMAEELAELRTDLLEAEGVVEALDRENNKLRAALAPFAAHYLLHRVVADLEDGQMAERPAIIWATYRAAFDAIPNASAPTPSDQKRKDVRE